MSAVAENRRVVASLYSMHASKLRNVLRFKVLQANCYGQTRGVCSQELDDLIQDVFARLLSSSALLSEDRDPVPYLVTMARNLYIDRQRRGTRVQLYACVEPVLSLVAHGELEDEPSREADLALRDAVDLESISCYLGRLPADLWTIYEARFVRGLSQRDTATFLGVSRRQVRTREERLLAGARQGIARESAE